MNVAHNKRFLTNGKEIQSTFIEILKNDPNCNITVKQLCDRAGMNRSTFYAHYSDVYDVADTIKRELVNELAKKYGEAPCCSETVFSRRSFYTLTEFLKKHRDFYFVSARSERFFPNCGLHAAFWNELIDGDKASTVVADTDEKKKCFAFFLIGLGGVLQQWIDDGCRTDETTLVDIIMKCVPACWRENGCDKQK